MKKRAVIPYARFLLLVCLSSAAVFIPWRNLQAACDLAPSRLVSWRTAEGNALDVAGTNNGTFTNRKGSNPADVLSVQGPIIFQGQTGTAFINLQAQGNENAVGCSLAFDPKVVTYTGASAGSDAVNAAMDVNANQASNGLVGVILELPTDTSFSPGIRQVVRVTFQAVTAASINSAVTLTNVPVSCEVSDTNANPVATALDNGTITINPKPSLAINHSSQNVNLSWPLWGTNYNLQRAIGITLPINAWTNLPVTPVSNNNALNVTLPVTNSVQFYRLKHQ